MAMFRWKCLSWRFTGGLCAKDAASLLFSVILADTKVHRAGSLFDVVRMMKSVFAVLCLAVPGLVLVAA